MQPSESLKYSAQRCLQNVPAIVIGSGYSAGYGLPTVAGLSKYLESSISPLDGESVRQWDEFKELSLTLNLEQVFQKVGTLTPTLFDSVIRKTWECIHEADLRAKLMAIREPRSQGLVRLLEFIFSSSIHETHIVTTNYDLLCEYAISSFGGVCATGFLPGEIGNREDGLPMKYYRGTTHARKVNLWKVHGSIDWFSHNSTIVKTHMNSLPPDFVPQIVTPGNEKYQRTYKEPFRSVLAGADLGLSAASSFICIGYGFNDEHIQEKLVDRVTRHARPICILAKELTPATKAFLETVKGDFFAAEEKDQESVVYSNEFRNGMIIPGSLWKLPNFLTWAFDRK